MDSSTYLANSSLKGAGTGIADIQSHEIGRVL